MRSELRKPVTSLLGLLLGLAVASVAAGQAPPPAAPVPTIWDKLGVTGAGKCFQSKFVNPHGNHPGLEKKPLLRPIADPANLDPKMPKAIQAAAAIKQQEDLAPQKIKAIKYLATLGCGCYQKNYPIREALLEALDDCTEDVRLEAATALCQVAGNPCSQCDGTCCNAETMNKLQEHASGKDANGCYKEPSAQVRAMSQAALDACRRKLPPGVAEATPVPVPVPVEGPKPILPPPSEHPSGVREMPAPLPPAPHAAPAAEPQPLPAPPAALKKPLEVPAEPSKSSAAPPLARPEMSSYVAILDVKPVLYEARTVKPLPVPVKSSEQPKVVLRLVIPADK
jgi:hypothetical protein